MLVKACGYIQLLAFLCSSADSVYRRISVLSSFISPDLLNRTGLSSLRQSCSPLPEYCHHFGPTRLSNPLALQPFFLHNALYVPCKHTLCIPTLYAFYIKPVYKHRRLCTVYRLSVLLAVPKANGMLRPKCNAVQMLQLHTSHLHAHPVSYRRLHTISVTCRHFDSLKIR